VIVELEAASSIRRLPADIRSGKKAVHVDGALRLPLSKWSTNINTERIQIELRYEN
jgi:hypothetical protein